MADPAIPIEITSTPTDWLTLLTAFLAAFLGAMAAFALNILLERLRERQSYLDKTNSAVYGLLMTIATLINIKEQYLSKFQEEFEEARKLLAEVGVPATPSERQATMRRFGLIIQSISTQDGQLNAAFMPWQAAEFPMMPIPEDFHFTLGHDAEIARLVHITRLETSGLSGLINERNTFWRANADAMFQEASGGTLGVRGSVFHYQMLSFRKILREHTDVALVVAKEALDRIEKYRADHLKKRNKYLRWFFRIFVRDEVWATYEPSKRMLRNIPDKQNYKTILESLDD